MRSNVNPFEPWRPTEAAVPPPLHAARPWRPPPPPPAATAVEEPLLVEPVNPPPRKKPPKRPHRPECPQGRPAQTSPPPRRSVAQWAAFVLFMVAAILCFDSLGWMRATHLPRLMVLGACAGMFTGMALNGRRSWRVRLTWMGATLAVAGIALWFVPTMRGVNLWSAYRQVETLRTLPAGEVAAYQSGAAARRTLVEELPSFAPDIHAAEQAWLRRTVSEAVESADRRLERDPHAALADLQRLNTELAQLEGYASVQKELETAWTRAVQACVNRVRREAEVAAPRP